MKASELIAELQALIEKHGDLEVSAYCDHDPVVGASFVEESWILDGRSGFELE